MNSLHFLCSFGYAGFDSLLERSQFKIHAILAVPRLDLSPWGFGILNFAN